MIFYESKATIGILSKQVFTYQTPIDFVAMSLYYIVMDPAKPSIRIRWNVVKVAVLDGLSTHNDPQIYAVLL